MVFVIMGVSGSGKSTVGSMLADRLQCPFLEGDDYHTDDAKEKMAGGEGLSDEDRWPWLELIADAINRAGGTVVCACSALKERYRQLLRERIGAPLQWIFLDGTEEVLRERLRNRGAHFAKAALLQSQLDDLERPPEALTFSIGLPPEKIADAVMRSIGRG